MTREGIVVKNQNGYFSVAMSREQIISVKVKGKLKLNRDGLCVGDRVRLVQAEDNTFLISEVLPRRNLLWRPPVANLDKVLVFMAIAEPSPNPVLLDHLLMMCELQGIEVGICFTKMDLQTADTERMIQVYRQLPYPVFPVSIQSEDNVAALQDWLQNGLTAVCGPSGVGKSTLLNRIAGRDIFATQKISQKIRRGKNTTRHAEIVFLNENTCIMDTPGFGSLDYLPENKDDLVLGFPEFRSHAEHCRFRDCLHLNEPDCGISAAVENQQISMGRYHSYRTLMEKFLIQEKEKYR